MRKQRQSKLDIQQGGDAPHVYRYDKVIVLRGCSFEQGGEENGEEITTELSNRRNLLGQQGSFEASGGRRTEKAGTRPTSRRSHAESMIGTTKAAVPSTVLLVPGQRVRPKSLPTIDACRNRVHDELNDRLR